MPLKVITSVTPNLPSVSVPVLSKASAFSPPMFSRCTPPLISTPLRAAWAMPANTAAGVPNASAHGEAATSNSMPR